MQSRLVFILLFFTITASAQQQAKYWTFGYNCGLNFNQQPPAFFQSAINTDEGCATACDLQGNLLFYTDGIIVYNRLHQPMKNGTGLLGDPSSSQCGTIIPYPDSTNKYIIFSVDAEAGSDGLNYHIVDMNAEGGLGDVLSKNNQLTTGVTEKITGIPHANGRDYWVIVHDWGNNHFLSYLVTPQGINTTPIVSAIGSVHGDDGLNAIGYMKASPDHKYLAIAMWGGTGIGASNRVELFRFNNLNGTISDLRLQHRFASRQVSAYGLEFSNNSKLLYIGITHGGLILQFNLDYADTANIAKSLTPVGKAPGMLGALQRGPDNKIYISMVNGSRLSAIHEPDQLGNACKFQDSVIVFPNTVNAKFGLPNFIPPDYRHPQIEVTDTCLYSSTRIGLGNYDDMDSVIWVIDGQRYHSTQPKDLPYIFNTPGQKTIQVSYFRAGLARSLLRSVNILDAPLPISIPDTNLCNLPLIITLPDPLLNYVWSDGTNQPQIHIKAPNKYWVTYHKNTPCIRTDTFIVKSCFCELYTPTAFSPNGDGVNDMYLVGGCETSAFELNIFNRWGELVFTTRSRSEAWDGTYMQQPCPADVYVYTIDYKVTDIRYPGLKHKSGTLTLIR